MIFVASALYGEANRLGFLEFICKSHFFRISDHRAAQGYVVRCEGMIKATSELPDFFRLSLNELKVKLMFHMSKLFHNTNLKKSERTANNFFIIIVFRFQKKMIKKWTVTARFFLGGLFAHFPLIFCSSYTYFPEYVNFSFW